MDHIQLLLLHFRATSNPDDSTSYFFFFLYTPSAVSGPLLVSGPLSEHLYTLATQAFLSQEVLFYFVSHIPCSYSVSN